MIAGLNCRGWKRVTYRFNELPLLYQRLLVLDLISGSPCLDLVSVPLELLNFSLEVILKLLLQGSIRRLLYLIEYAFECLYAFGHFLEGLVNILLKLSGGHGVTAGVLRCSGRVRDRISRAISDMYDRPCVGLWIYDAHSVSHKTDVAVEQR